MSVAMSQSASREIHVTYEDYKRMVPLENDTYDALLEGFLETFKDVLPPEARDAVLFQLYVAAIDDYVDIQRGEKIQIDWKKITAKTIKHGSRIGDSYPLVDGEKYTLWALGSRADNGYLRRKDATTVAADGDGETVECEWLAHIVKPTSATFWKFSSPDNTKVLVVENDQVTLKDPLRVAGTTDQFFPIRNGRYQSFLPRAMYEVSSDKKFLGVHSSGTVKMVTNKNPQRGNRYNPIPQTLFVPFLHA